MKNQLEDWLQMETDVRINIGKCSVGARGLLRAVQLKNINVLLIRDIGN